MGEVSPSALCHSCDSMPVLNHTTSEHCALRAEAGPASVLLSRTYCMPHEAFSPYAAAASVLTAAVVLSLHCDDAAVLRDGVDDSHRVCWGAKQAFAAGDACRGQVRWQPLGSEAGWRALLCAAVGCKEARWGNCTQKMRAYRQHGVVTAVAVWCMCRVGSLGKTDSVHPRASSVNVAHLANTRVLMHTQNHIASMINPGGKHVIHVRS
jgi:hypothetical protein